MSLIIHGGRMESAECCQLRSEKSDQVVENPAVAATLKLDVEDAFLEFESAQAGGRPFLMLMGRPLSVQGDFPFNISEMHYDGPFDRGLMAYRYDFTRENLADLARKGLYEPGFEPPAIIRRNVFELPCTVACAAMGPVSKDDIPVIFASVNQSSLECTDRTSGYEISEYFEMMPVRQDDMGRALDEVQAARKVLYDRAREEAQQAIEAAVPDIAPKPEQEATAEQPEAEAVDRSAEFYEALRPEAAAWEAAPEPAPEAPVKPVKRNAFADVEFKTPDGDEDEFLTGE